MCFTACTRSSGLTEKDGQLDRAHLYSSHGILGLFVKILHTTKTLDLYTSCRCADTQLTLTSQRSIMLHIIQYQPFFTVVKTFQLIYYLSLSGIQCTKKNSKCLHVGTIPFVSYCSSALLQTDVKITSNRSKPLRDFT